MERYKEIFNKSPYGIIILDENGFIKEFNDYTLKVLKCSDKYLIGNNFDNIFFNDTIFKKLILNQKNSRTIVFNNKDNELKKINFKIQSIDKHTLVVYFREVKNNDSKSTAKKNKCICKKVMIIDDDKFSRIITRKMLEEIGYEVIDFSKGLEAIEFYTKHYKDIDMVLLDMVLKDIPGQEVYGYLKEIYKKCNIVVLTGNDNKQVQEKFNIRKINIMQKPVTKEQLSKALLNVFYNRKIKNNTYTSVNNLSFDYKRGIKYFEGNVELYDILLNDFIDMYKDSIKEMNKYIIKSHEEAIRLAHNIKSVSANLGANKLHKQAKELEKYFINNGFNINNVEMQELMRQLSVELNIFIISINNYLQQKQNENSNDTVKKY